MRKILYSLVVVLSALSLSSCDDEPVYPTLDPNLQGMWQLVAIDGYPVGGYDANWLQFYGDGSGTYFYYNNGLLQQMGLFYSVNYDWTQLYVDYADGWSLDSNYWFDRTATLLYMQWWDEYGRQTVYTYQLSSWQPGFPAPAKPLDISAEKPADGSADAIVSTRPANVRPR